MLSSAQGTREDHDDDHREEADEQVHHDEGLRHILINCSSWSTQTRAARTLFSLAFNFLTCASVPCPLLSSEVRRGWVLCGSVWFGFLFFYDTQSDRHDASHNKLLSCPFGAAAC